MAIMIKRKLRFKNDGGFTLLSVLIFAMLFAVLVSKILSSLVETKASTPRVAGAAIERHVSQAVMAEVIGKCNQMRTTPSPHPSDLPNTIFGCTGILDNAVASDCTYTTSSVTVDMGLKSTETNPKTFPAAVTVKITDLDTDAGKYQWDCEDIEVNTKIQG